MLCDETWKEPSLELHTAGLLRDRAWTRAVRAVRADRSGGGVSRYAQDRRCSRLGAPVLNQLMMTHRCTSFLTCSTVINDLLRSHKFA